MATERRIEANRENAKKPFEGQKGGQNHGD